VDFAVLGPVAARHDGRELPLGGPKQRAVLAMLLLRANQVVSRDRLIDGLWGERPPPTAAHTLDTYIARLRKTLGDGRLARRAPGYALQVDVGELDLERFEDLYERGRMQLSEGDAAAAAETLRSALALWRGNALADVIYEPFASVEADRLEERRLSALEDRVDAEMALGAAAELVAELEALVQEHPFRERLLGQLMLALYRSGRQAEALEALRRARHRLAEELGLEPGPELQEMQRKILEHDQSLATPPVDATEEDRPAPRRPARTRAAVGAAVAAVAVSAAIGIVLGIRDTNASRDAEGSNGLIALSTGSGDPSVSVDLDAAPAAVAYLDGAVWLADATVGAVSQIDVETAAVVDRVRVQSGVGALIAGAGTLWAANVPGAEVARVDPATGMVTQTIPLGSARAGALGFGANRLWISDLTDDALIEVEAQSGKPIRAIPLELHPTALAASGQSIWAADYAAGTIAEVDARSGQTVSMVHVGNGPVAIAVRPDAVWVVNSLDATVSRVDRQTHAVIATIPVGSGPSAVAATKGSIWVANEYSGTVSRIDQTTNLVADTSVVGGAPTSLTILDDEVWVGVRSVVQRRGGTLVLQHTRPISIDPALHLDVLPPVADDLTRDGLVTYNHVAGPAGTYLVPNLAVSIPAPTNGGRTYTFRLRPGIRYSDERLVRAADFRRALERVFALGSHGKYLFTGIVGANACAPGSGHCDLSRGITTNEQARTVTFHLRDPDASFLTNLTVGGLATPAPPGTPMRPARSEPIPGTGPYMIASVSPAEIRYVRNPFFREWSRAAKPDGNPDEIVMRFDERPEALVAAVEDGRADWTTEAVPASRLSEIARTFPDQLHSHANPVVEFFQLNSTVAPFDDVRVRRALNFAFDRGTVVSRLGGEIAATPTCQVLPPGVRGYRRYCPYTRSPRADGRWTAPDVERAQRLVDASGTRGTLVAVWGITDDPTLGPPVTKLMASTLRRLGYRTRLCLVPSSFTPIPDGCDPARIQLGPAGWSDLFAYGYFGLWVSCGGSNNRGFCDPRLDARMHMARSLEVTDPRAAALAWEKIDREVADRALWVPIVNTRMIDFVSSRVRNYQFHPYWGFLASQAWLR
jgi:YVTN family beta-propeller protein